MLENVKTVVLRLSAMAALISVLDALLPDGRASEGFRFLAGAVAALTVAEPFFGK